MTTSDQVLSGKVAVVTGGSAGIGRAISIAFASSGASVVAVGRDRDRLAETERLSGRLCHSLCCDLQTADGPARVVDEAIRSFGGLDILVHSAGVFLPRPFARSSLEEFDLQWRTNVRAPFALTQAAVPCLRAGSAVVFISSIAGLVGFPESAAYCATKGAVELMARALTLELAPAGIRINCIAPGNVRTAMNAALLANPDYERSMLARTPAGRIGDVKDVAGAAVYLASDAASYVYGATLVVDGGWTAA